MKATISAKVESRGMLPIRGSLLPANEQEFKFLEQKVSATLAEQYRDFLKTYGASTFSEYVDLHPLHKLPATISSDGDGHISSFYGVQAIFKEIDITPIAFRTIPAPIGGSP